MSGFVKVAETREVPAGEMLIVSGFDRVDICLVNLNEEYYAFSGVCTHKGGPLYRGSVRGKHIVCPWHGAAFNVKDGQDSWPAERPLRTFEVKSEGGSLYLKVPSRAKGGDTPGREDAI